MERSVIRERRRHIARAVPDYAALHPGYALMPLASRAAVSIFSLTKRKTGDFDMLARDEDILKAAEDWRREGRDVALATVVETWGSAPRPVGSNLVIDKDGNFLGSVSGGCVEGAVVTEAIDVIESGKPRMLEFGVADDTAWKVGLSCGGTIRVYVEKVE
jgi:XdhC and CoxI family